MAKRVLRSGKQYEEVFFNSSDDEETPNEKKNTLDIKIKNKNVKRSTKKQKYRSSKTNNPTTSKKIKNEIIVLSDSDTEDEKPEKKKIKIDVDVSSFKKSENHFSEKEKVSVREDKIQSNMKNENSEKNKIKIDPEIIRISEKVEINKDITQLNTKNENPESKKNKFEPEIVQKNIKIDLDIVSSSEKDIIQSNIKDENPKKKKIKIEPEIIELSEENLCFENEEKTRKRARSDLKDEKPNNKILKTEPEIIELLEEDIPEKEVRNKKTTRWDTIDEKAKNKNNKNETLTFKWTEEDLFSEREGISKDVARSVVKLFKQENTIPFIARYRRHLTGDMSAGQLRNMKEVYDDIVELKCKSEKILKNIEKTGHLNSNLKDTILSCKNIEELEHIYAPFKEPGKKSLAERAKSLGLEPAAISLLYENKDVNLYMLIQKDGPEGIRNIEEVKKNLMNLLGHMICHNSDVLTFLRDLKNTVTYRIETNISSTAKKNAEGDKVMKFNHYFGGNFSSKLIQPHQILAINRGESLKVLTVKVRIPDYVLTKFKDFCRNKWYIGTCAHTSRSKILNDTLIEIYSKNIIPLLSRGIRSELKAVAHKSATEIFAKNLKQLLLESPIKGKVIMGIDPGIKLGCKVALISPEGDVLDTFIIYPHSFKKINSVELIRSRIVEYNCTLIVIGNGTACRETETWLSNLIQTDVFKPYDVSYSIVDESGASIYSCSEEAKKEFPTLDPLHISAISLARRAQDPLAELVKIDPKNLGVGMYQHDINHKTLTNTLGEVISECVSFVGVDINTASYNLLRHVAGLTSQRAENLIKYRQEKGRFTNRYQIKNIKGIGEKVFEQCAGFLRIIPNNSSDAMQFYETPNTTPLDATDIHPEAYSVAEELLKTFGLSYKEIGQPDFILKFKEKINSINVEECAKRWKTREQTLTLIMDALCKPLSYDLRTDNHQGSIFKKNITKLSDLKPKMVLTGQIRNVVIFGAFVDIGVGRDGLIHKSNSRGFDLHLGQRVEVEVLAVDKDFSRINLKMLNILT